MAIEEIIHEAGFPTATFQSLFVTSDQVKDVIAAPRVKAVTLTGSRPAGASVASIAGQHIKKTVLELGGSDFYVILEDADLEKIQSMTTIWRYKKQWIWSRVESAWHS